MKQFNFIPNATKGYYNVEDSTKYKDGIIFYQISMFANPKTDKHHIRCFILNKKDELINIKQYQVNEATYNKFVKEKGVHEYKLYPVYNLYTTEYPDIADIRLARSTLLSDTSTYGSYASF